MCFTIYKRHSIQLGICPHVPDTDNLANKILNVKVTERNQELKTGSWNNSEEIVEWKVWDKHRNTEITSINEYFKPLNKVFEGRNLLKKNSTFKKIFSFQTIMSNIQFFLPNVNNLNPRNFQHIFLLYLCSEQLVREFSMRKDLETQINGIHYMEYFFFS